MNVHRLITTASAVLCACALVVAGCASSGVAATQSTAASGAAGLYPVSVDGKWGYIDKTGVTVKSNRSSTWLVDFSDGLASGDDGGRCRRSPATSTPPAPWSSSRSSTCPWPSRRGWRRWDKRPKTIRFGFIDKTGAVVIPTQYERFPTGKFSEGLCAVMIQKDGKTGASSTRRAPW